MAVNDIYQATVTGSIDGQQTNNVLNFRDSDVLVGDENTLAEAICECFIDSLIPGLSSDFTLQQVSVKKILPTAGNEAIFTPATGAIGGIAGSLPSFNAAVLSLRTAKGSKSGRGRMYLAGLPNTGENASRVSDSLQSVIVAFAVCMIGKFVSGPLLEGFEWGVLSKKNLAATPGDQSSWWSPITETVVNQSIGTMRSRKIGSGS